MFALLTRAGVTSQPGEAEDKGFILFFKCWSINFYGVQSIAVEDAVSCISSAFFNFKDCSDTNL